MSTFWANNKDSIISGAKSVGKVGYSGAKTIGKAGYQAGKSHYNNSKARREGGGTSSETEFRGEAASLDTLQDPSRFAPPPLKPGQKQYTKGAGVVEGAAVTEGQRQQQPPGYEASQNQGYEASQNRGYEAAQNQSFVASGADHVQPGVYYAQQGGPGAQPVAPVAPQAGQPPPAPPRALPTPGGVVPTPGGVVPTPGGAQEMPQSVNYYSQAAPVTQYAPSAQAAPSIPNRNYGQHVASAPLASTSSPTPVALPPRASPTEEPRATPSKYQVTPYQRPDPDAPKKKIDIRQVDITSFSPPPTHKDKSTTPEYVPSFRRSETMSPQPPSRSSTISTPIEAKFPAQSSTEAPQPQPPSRSSTFEKPPSYRSEASPEPELPPSLPKREISGPPPPVARKETVKRETVKRETVSERTAQQPKAAVVGEYDYNKKIDFAPPPKPHRFQDTPAAIPSHAALHAAPRAAPRAVPALPKRAVPSSHDATLVSPVPRAGDALSGVSNNEQPLPPARAPLSTFAPPPKPHRSVAEPVASGSSILTPPPKPLRRVETLPPYTETAGEPMAPRKLASGPGALQTASVSGSSKKVPPPVKKKPQALSAMSFDDVAKVAAAKKKAPPPVKRKPATSSEDSDNPFAQYLSSAVPTSKDRLH